MIKDRTDAFERYLRVRMYLRGGILMSNGTLHPSIQRRIVSSSRYFRERSRREPTLATAILFETIKTHVSIVEAALAKEKTTSQTRTKVVCIFYHSSIRSGVSRSAWHGAARDAAKSLGMDGEKARRRQRTESGQREERVALVLLFPLLFFLFFFSFFFLSIPPGV